MSAENGNGGVFESRTFNLPVDNIDTDQIIPAQFLTTTTREGLGQYCFYSWRFDEDGSPKASSPLRKHDASSQMVLVTGSNFGCGSSREHAPWSLLDFGIRCVIAPSFADIFFNNCFKNGILPIVLPQEQIDALMEDAEKGANAIVTVDLERQEITRPDGETIAFEVDSFRKHCLLNGLDDVGLTLEKAAAVGTYEDRQKVEQPWLY